MGQPDVLGLRLLRRPLVLLLRVLPAVLLFVPYRLITGHMLPTAAAEQFLVLLFIIFFSLLVLRVIHRVMSKTSLAAASLITVSALLGAQMGYLAYRTNFYQVPSPLLWR